MAATREAGLERCLVSNGLQLVRPIMTNVSQTAAECRNETLLGSETEMSSFNAKYVVITPVRDEEAHLRGTLECMLRQTILPTEWIIVNDGSTDDTGRLAVYREIRWGSVV
jgi:hypothetical protein